MPAEEQGFLRANGPNYFSLLGAMHKVLKPSLYLEVGSRTGNSLALAYCDFIAIDPVFKLKRLSTFPGRAAHFFQVPSDEFFGSGFLGKAGLKPDFCFLDGMHHFEFLLRDFMNAEETAAPGAVIALHDCCPFNAVMTDRTWIRRRTREWTGDVWKVLTILLTHRPDLAIKVYDAAPTGLVVIENADPANRVLRDKYEQLIADYSDLHISDYGPETFYGQFRYADTAAYIAAAQTE